MPNSDWRTSFAEFLVRDPMLSRNLANRLWKAVFGLALVEPVDALDPDRLDPSKPAVTDGKLSPLQASHPRLLEQLAKELEARNFDLREFLKLLTESSAYQLSSRYEGNWNLDYVPLFARHYPRRLEGEEIHDMLHKATGTVTSYTVTGMPEPLEPRTNTAGGLVFMNFFYRGNRDTVLRNQSGSILQQLALMNNTFVTNKVKVAASPVLRSLVAITDNGALADQAYLTFLGRYPTLPEKQAVMAHMARSTTAAARNTAVEDLGWALINQVEYLFSY
jgi:hypothetical protein